MIWGEGRHPHMEQYLPIKVTCSPFVVWYIYGGGHVGGLGGKAV